MSVGHRFGGHVTVSAGGMEFDFGAGTEATSADKDGWITGYRVKAEKLGRRFGVDEMSFTTGYVGDFRLQNFFSRLNRMTDHNYTQFMLVRTLDDNSRASFDISEINGIPWLRAAVRRQNLPVLHNDLVVEAIGRTGGQESFGWSANVSRVVEKTLRVRPGLTYSDIPAKLFAQNGQQILLNGDPIVLGKRLGASVVFTPLPNLDFMLFASRRLDGTPGHLNREQVVIRYYLTDALKKVFAR